MNTRSKLTLLACDWNLALDRLDYRKRKLSPVEQAERDTIQRLLDQFIEVLKTIPQ